MNEEKCFLCEHELTFFEYIETKTHIDRYKNIGETYICSNCNAFYDIYYKEDVLRLVQTGILDTIKRVYNGTKENINGE